MIGTDKLKYIENIIAGNYNDTIKGSNAANTLNGGLGTDTLYGGLGQDLLYGGSDTVRDVFDFNAIAESKVVSTRDKIYNFVTGKDDIDLSGIDANTRTGVIKLSSSVARPKLPMASGTKSLVLTFSFMPTSMVTKYPIWISRLSESASSWLRTLFCDLNFSLRRLLIG